MKFGMMNNPAKDLREEIKYAARNKFDFIDITLEGKADYENIDINEAKKSLKKNNLFAVGHTSWYLSAGDELKEFREATIKVMRKNLKIFSALGIKLVNIHAFTFTSFLGEEKLLKNFIASLRELLKEAKKYNIDIMIENCEPVTDIGIISKLMKALPELKLHLDIGHANLKYRKNKTEEYFKKFSKRIVHVHVSDNFGGKEDLHLPIGEGNIKWKKIAFVLKKYNYNRTITLEVFKGGRKALIKSTNKLRNLL
jgi:sugar phosphate isomerase/epimerase